MNLRGLSLSRSLVFAVGAISVVAAMGVRTFAAYDLRPSWLPGGPSRISANSSFLSFLSVESQGWQEASTPLMSDSMAASMRQEYQDLVRWHDVQSTYGLVDRHEQSAHNSRVSGFSGSVLNRVQQYKVKASAKEFLSVAERSQTIAKVKKPVGVVIAAAAIYGGQPVDLNITRDMRLTARTNVPAGRGNISMISPLINGAVDFAPATSDERYRLSLSRPLMLDVNSSLTFGTTTNKLTASFSRSVFIPDLTCVVDSTRYLAPNPALPETSLRFLYGLTF